MNRWLKEFGRRKNFFLLSYEKLRADPASNFRLLLAALGEPAPDPEAFAHALAFSEFENMKRLEAAGAFDSKILKPGDVTDPESFKVRRGKDRRLSGISFRRRSALRGKSDAADLHPRFGYNS